MEEKFKIKPLTKEQIIISLDRLTRFKPTEEKYLRVFKDIIISNLLYPKYKKAELNSMDYGQITRIIENIFTLSFNSLNIKPTEDYSINQKLLEYEKSVFKFNKNVQKFLENKIDYRAIIEIFEGKKLPLNLVWLKSLAKNDNQITNRVKFGLKFPLEKIVLVEGITEEILLPEFAKVCKLDEEEGFDFDKEGIHVISAGGKNQVVKLFYKFSDILKLPMFVLLDNDAGENFNEIKSKLRDKDKVHVLKCGEFEDTLPLKLIKRTLNKNIKDFSPVLISDLKRALPMTKILEDVLKQRGMEFKKAEFASLIMENISSQNDISPEIDTIVTELKNK